jgi:uncharacterized RDD family membrane protein YckC
MGGASIDTTRAGDKSRMVIAGNIDFPLPPPPSPSSSQPPKPPLPKAEGGMLETPEKEALSQTAAVADANPIPAKPLYLPPSTPSPLLNVPTLAVPMGRPAHMIYAGFWYRFLAWLIDIVILGTVQGILAAVVLMTSAAFVFRGSHFSDPSLWLFIGAYGVIFLINAILSLLYFAWSESSHWQGTLGKLAIGLKVTDADGDRISFLRALSRYFAHIITNMTFGIGYLLNVFTSRQQTLHDLVAGTLVVYKEVTPTDLTNNPAVPARGSQKALVLLVWIMSLMFLMTVILVGQSLVEMPKYQTSETSFKMYEAERLGSQATVAASDYWENHGRFPLTLEAADFRQTSTQVRRIWIDAESGVIHLELGFSPFRKKTLLFVPESDKDGDLIWRCRSDDIDPQYLPEHCR